MEEQTRGYQNLEDFIRRHRSELDHEEPDAAVWARIDSDLTGSNRVAVRMRLWPRLAVAASIALVTGLAAGYAAYPAWDTYRQGQALADLGDYREVSRYFDDQVSARFARLPAAMQEGTVGEELKALDHELAQMRIDLLRAPKDAREWVMAAIISIYEAKVSVLESALQNKQGNYNDDDIHSL